MEDTATTTSAEDEQVAEKVAGAILGIDYVIEDKFRPVAALVDEWRNKTLGEIGLLVGKIMGVNLGYLEDGDESESAWENAWEHRADMYASMSQHLTALGEALATCDGRDWLGNSPELKDL